MTVKLLTEHLLEFISLKGGCTGLSESTLVKMPYCWKSHVAAHISFIYTVFNLISTPALIYTHTRVLYQLFTIGEVKQKF